MVKHYWSLFGILSAIVITVRGDVFAYPQSFNKMDENISIDNITKYGNNFYWTLPYAMQLNQMFYIALFGDFKVDGLIVFGNNASDLPTTYQCYYFAPVNQTDQNCRRKAEEDNCAYIPTQSLNVTYQSEDNANFGIRYAYALCSDRESSTPISTTTTTTISTSPTVNISVIDGRRKPTKQESTTGTSANSENSTSHRNNGQGDQTTLIIAVAVTAVLFVIITLILLFCGIRFSRNREQNKAARLQKHQESSIAPSPDALYEEILPVLPARNPNMQDHAYEIPISTNQNNANGGTAMHTNNNTDYVTIQNELYHGVAGSANENIESFVLENESDSDESETGSEHLNEDQENSVPSEVLNVLYHT